MNRLFVLAVLLALLAMPTASAHVTMYFEPQDSNIPEGYCNTKYVRVMANTTSPDNLWSGQFAIYHNELCANITDLQWGSQVNTFDSAWNPGTDCVGTDYEWIKFTFFGPQTGVVEICNITIHCNCSSCDYCISPLDFSCGTDCPMCPIQLIKYVTPPVNLYPASTTLVSGTVACGEQSPETFSKPLYEGWNLISLPLTPDDNSTSAVLSGVSDVVYRYNATSKEFECPSTMDPGTGYFVYVTTASTWTYEGYAYTSMDVSLEQGLNMVGWLNCSMDVSDALASVDYNHVARWNANEQRYEVYNPRAPSAFNDFTTMDRGTGYFISAKGEYTLTKSC